MKKKFVWASLKSLKKGVGSGAWSISKRYGSADPDPHQNVTDPQHCLFQKEVSVGSILFVIGCLSQDAKVPQGPCNEGLSCTIWVPYPFTKNRGSWSGSLKIQLKTDNRQVMLSVHFRLYMFTFIICFVETRLVASIPKPFSDKN